MISCINHETIQYFGLPHISQFHLRHRCFVERQQYNVRSYKGMEYDQYDTPAATYLVYESPSGEAWGCSRLTPVQQGSMIKDLWPDLVTDPRILNREDVWEGTRFCIDKSLPPAIRARICKELVIAYLEFGLLNKIKSIIGVMPPPIFKRVFRGAGCDYRLLGPEKIVDGIPIRAAELKVSEEMISRARDFTGIHDALLKMNQAQRPVNENNPNIHKRVQK
jgi:N-acyl-L-homoserine lactone synthetase